MENEKKNESSEIIVIDVEANAKEGKEVPKGPRYHYLITVDRQKFKVKEECMKGREILILAGKTPPERFQLNQRFRGGKVVKVGYDEKVCFTAPGVEKFMTIPLDQTEGGK